MTRENSSGEVIRFAGEREKSAALKGEAERETENFYIRQQLPTCLYPRDKPFRSYYEELSDYSN